MKECRRTQCATTRRGQLCINMAPKFSDGEALEAIMEAMEALEESPAKYATLYLDDVEVDIYPGDCLIELFYGWKKKYSR